MSFDENENEFVKRVSEAFKKKGVPLPPNCQICKIGKWAISTSFIVNKSVIPYSKSEPDTSAFVAVICQNCGQTVFFNARHLGLADYFWK